MSKEHLKILREDTYADEYSDQMISDMITRSEYKVPMKDEIIHFHLKNGVVVELNGKTQKAYNFLTGDVLFTFEKMTGQEFIRIMSNYNK